jgi:hypothetical protein
MFLLPARKALRPMQTMAMHRRFALSTSTPDKGPEADFMSEVAESYKKSLSNFDQRALLS